MAGTRALTKLQLGRESTPGLAVAASTIWRGLGLLEDARVVEYYGAEEYVGIITGTNRTYIPKLESVLSMENTPATFEQLPHILEAGIRTITPAADGAGTDFIYSYDIPTTTLPTIKTYTLEGGDNQQAEEMEHAFVESFSIEGNAGEGLMMSADWRGRQIVNTTFTGALAIPAVEEILFNKGLLYIDDNSGSFGTTLISNTLLSMSLSYNTGLMAKWTMDNQLYFSFVQFTRPEITLDLTFEHNALAVLEKTDWRSENPRAIRLIFEGSAVGTPGTTYSNKTLIIDLAGAYTEFSALGETDGNNTYDVSFRVGYDPTLATVGNITVVNELSVLP